jgi:N4-(beta-N-acetylglucosaminyl)-L-asparaginase
VGDSPIIGAGLYVDNGVGAAGATGNGEANIRVVGAHTVVELMRQGKAPEQACMETLKRVVDLFKGNPPQLNFYAVNKKGESGAASIYKGASYCLHDGALSYRLESAWLLERSPLEHRIVFGYCRRRGTRGLVWKSGKSLFKQRRF